MSDTAKKTVAARLNPSTIERLKARAEAAGVTVSLIASQILDAATADDDGPAAPPVSAHRWTADVQRGQVCAVCGSSKDTAAPSCTGSRTRI